MKKDAPVETPVALAGGSAIKYWDFLPILVTGLIFLIFLKCFARGFLSQKLTADLFRGSFWF